MYDVFVPYKGKVHPLLLHTLGRFPLHLVEMPDDDEGYPDYFAQRWREGIPFVNVEHDVIVWPGALDQIMDCPEIWCVYTYGPTPQGDGPYLGCAKFDNALFMKLPNLWDADKWDDPTYTRHWLHCDSHLERHALAAGIRPHLHNPPVTHGHWRSDWEW